MTTTMTNTAFNTPSKLARGRKTPKKTPTHGDRFIPNRAAMDMELCHYNMMKENNCANVNTDSPHKEYKMNLAQSLFSKSPNGKILAFKNKAPAPKEGFQNPSHVLYSQNKSAMSTAVKSRHISSQPAKMLDAPDLMDDYYLHVLDWHKQTNLLAIALTSTVYLWNPSNKGIVKLTELEEPNYVCSVSCMPDAPYLALGTSDNEVQIYDISQSRLVRTMKGHLGRVGCLSWNGHMLSSGSRDGSIIHHDVRVANHQIATLQNHTQEVCGLKWSPDGSQLASGGNDNVVNIWDMNGTAPKHTFTQHQAAVRALAWCPWEANLLATGGGTADKTIKFWNTASGALLNSIDTQSQVCSLQWSPSSHYREIVSSHGFTQNQLVVWKYPTMAKLQELNGHSSRVLHTCISPDGESIVSAAGDERMMFWNVWPRVAPAASVRAKGTESPRSTMKPLHIR